MEKESDLEKQIEVCNLAMPVHDIKSVLGKKCNYYICNATTELKKCDNRNNPDACNTYRVYYQHLYMRG